MTAPSYPVFTESCVRAGTICYHLIDQEYPAGGDDVTWWTLDEARRFAAHAPAGAAGSYARNVLASVEEIAR